VCVSRDDDVEQTPRVPSQGPSCLALTRLVAPQMPSTSLLYHPGVGRVVTYANGVEKHAVALSMLSNKRAGFLTGVTTVVSSTGAVIHLDVAHRTSELLIKACYCRGISRSMCMHLIAFVSISHTGIWATLTQIAQSLVSLLHRAIFWSIPCCRLQCPSHLVVNDLRVNVGTQDSSTMTLPARQSMLSARSPQS
jgi:hypothetical protein